MKPNRSNPLFGHLFRSNVLGAAVVLTLTGVAAIPSASAQSISVNFGADRDAIDAVAEPAGAVSVLGSNWNNASGASGTLASLKNSAGAITAASITWTSNGTYLSAATDVGTANENGDLTKGYLDDGGTGWTINMVSPYLLNNIYAIHATDQGTVATMSAVSFNGVFQKGNGTVTTPANGQGDSWSATNWSNADTLTESANYLRVTNQPQVSIAGLNASPGRAAIAGLQIENAYLGTLAYWDLDGTTPGAGGGTTPIGVWNASNTNWSSSDAGDVATSAWTAGNAAVFSAGTTATSAYTVLALGTQSADAVWARNGTVTLGDGGSGQITLTGSAILRGDTGLVVDIPVSATNLMTAGTVTLNNGSNSITGLASIFGTTTLGANHSFGSLAGGGTLALGTRTLATGSDNTDSSFAGLLTGTVSINKSGTGRLTLLNNNTGFTGTTTVSGGILRLGGGGTTGAISGTINGAGTVEFLRSDSSVIATAFTGNGPLKFLGTGVTSQSQYDFGAATSGFTGAVSIDDSRLKIDPADLDLATSITVVDGGQAWLQAGTHIENYTLNGIGWLEGTNNLGAMRIENSTVTGSVNIATAARIVAYNGANGTISGALLGSANLEINLAANTTANGTVNLTNAAGYTGNLMLSRGILNASALGGGLSVTTGTANLTGAVAGAVTLNSGILNLNSGASIASPTVIGGALNVNTGSTVTGALSMPTGTTLGLAGGALGGGLTLGSAGTDTHTLNFTSTVAITGNLTASGTQTVNLVNQPAVGGAITLLTYTGTGSDPVDANLQNNFVLGGVGTNYRSATFTDTGSAITLGVGNVNLTWGGADGTNPTFWNAGSTSTPNWSGGDTRFYQGDAVTFNDTATGVTVAMQSLLAPSAVTFNNTTKNFTVTGATGTGLTGAASLTKSGTGSLTLGGVGSTFTGAVAINGGVLNLNNGEALGFNSGITITNGGALNFNSHAPSNQGRHYSWTIAGTGSDGAGGLGTIYTTNATDINQNAGILNLTLAGNAEVGGNNGRFDIGRSGANYGTVTGGGFTLTKVGSNSVVVRAPASNITYVVDVGMLSFEDSDTASGSNPITVNGIAKMGSYGLRTLANNVTLNTGTTLISRGGDTGTWTGIITAAGNVNFQTDSNLVIDGSLTGTGNITRAGGNTLVLQNTAASYSGKIINTAGTLRIESAGAIGTATGADVITIGASTLQGGTFAAMASATVGSATQGITQTGNVTYDAGTGNTLTIAGAVTGTGNLTKANNTGAVTFEGVSSTGSFTGNNGTTTFNGALSLAGGMADIGGGMVTNINSPTVTLGTGTYGIHCLAGTTNINIGTGTFADMEVGNSGSASHTINHLAGALTVTNDFRVGHYGSETSTYNISAGSVSMPDSVTNTGDESQANLMLGIDGSGILNISGTGVVNTSSLVVNGRSEGHNAAQADTLNLTGGRLNLGKWGMRTYGTTYAVNLGGGILGASADWSSSLAMSLTGTGGNVSINTLDFVNNTTPRTITLSGALSGTGGLTKAGAGNLVVSGTNTYTGATAVNGGMLYLGTASASTVSVNAGAALQAGSPVASATTTVAGLTLNGGTALFRANYTSGDKLVVSGTDTFTVPATTTISVQPAGDLLANDEIPLIDYTGLEISATEFNRLTLAPISNPHYTGELVHDTIDTKVLLRITNADTIFWKGNVNGNWDLNTTSNWVLNSDGFTSSKFYEFDTVTLDDEGLASPTLTLVGTITPGGVIKVMNTTGTYTLQGSGISGGASLIKTGAGGLVLLNGNSYIGSTTISGGSLIVGNGGTTGTLGGTGAITIGTGATLGYNRSDAVILPGSRGITGPGGMVYNGSGSLDFQGQNAFAGGLTVNSGTVILSGGGWYVNPAQGTGMLTVNSGGVAVNWNSHSFGGSYSPDADMTLNGGKFQIRSGTYVDDIWMTGGTIEDYPGFTSQLQTRGGGGTVVTVEDSAVQSVISTTYFTGEGSSTITVNDPDTKFLISGKITGGQVITKSGVGTMEWTGDNVGFTGGVALNGGKLEVASIADIGGVGSLAKFDGTAPSAGYLGIANDATFRYLGIGTETTTRNLWIDTGSQTKTIEVVSPTANITFAGTGGNINKPLSKTGAGALTINDVMAVGTTVTVDGGKLTLGGANTYTGDTVVNATGTLVVDGDSIADTGRLDINGSGIVQVTEVVDPVLEVVETLYIDGIQMASGTYGATGSGATHVDDVHFAGAGVVDVTTGPVTGYGTWASTNAPTGTGSDDYDGDGVSNAVEWVLGGLATTGDLDKLPDISVSGGDLIFTFVRNDAAWDGSDTTVAIEVGTGLNAWPLSYSVPKDPGVYGPLTVANDGTTDIITLTVPMAADTKKFARLRVNVAP